MQSNPYNKWQGQFKPDYSRMRSDPRQLAKAQQESSQMQGWANAAPYIGAGLGGIAGGLIGGLPTGGMGAVPGAGLGASIGQQLGTAVGGGLQSQAQNKMDPFRQKEMEKEALMMALQGWG